MPAVVLSCVSAGAVEDIRLWMSYHQVVGDCVSHSEDANSMSMLIVRETWKTTMENSFRVFEFFVRTLLTLIIHCH